MGLGEAYLHAMKKNGLSAQQWKRTSAPNMNIPVVVIIITNTIQSEH